jgi:hypothetical protein
MIHDAPSRALSPSTAPSSSRASVPPPSGVVRVPGPALWRAPPATLPVTELLRECLAVSYKGVLTRDECEIFTDRVYAARAHWIENFGGAQYTLGRAWYTDLEQDRERDYFERAQESDDLVERVAPGLQQRMYDLIGTALGHDVDQREGWCGPGVHVFPPTGDVGVHGGDVHYDTEGLTEDQIATRAPAVSCILMLQPAESAGGLRVWDRLYDERPMHHSGERVAMPDDSVRNAIATYATGDLVVIDSYRLHQIQAFGGALERISVTAHAVFTGERWEVWF